VLNPNHITIRNKTQIKEISVLILSLKPDPDSKKEDLPFSYRINVTDMILLEKHTARNNKNNVDINKTVVPFKTIELKTKNNFN
jgi:hypothetical protein